MDRKDKDDEILELTDDEIDEIEFEEQLAEGECEKEIPEYYFSNPAPYAKVTPRPVDAPQRNFRFDEEGHIVVKNHRRSGCRISMSWTRSAARSSL